MGEVEYEFTFGTGQNWSGEIQLDLALDETYLLESLGVVEDLDEGMQGLKKDFERQGATFRWTKSPHNDGSVTYRVKTSGTDWSALESLYDINFDTEQSGGRELVHLRYRLTTGETARESVLRIHVPEVVESNADVVTQGTAVWHDPTDVYLVFAQQKPFPWTYVLVGGGCCSFLAIVLLTWALLWRRRRKVDHPPQQHDPDPMPSASPPTPAPPSQPAAPSMSPDAVRQAVQQAVQAAQSGQRSKAQVILRRVVEVEPANEQGWLWLSGVVDSDQERIRCLRRVLEINPDHPAAIRGLKKLAPGYLESLQAEEQALQEQLAQEKAALQEAEAKSELRVRNRKLLAGLIAWPVLTVIMSALAYGIMIGVLELVEPVFEPIFPPDALESAGDGTMSALLFGLCCCPSIFGTILSTGLTIKTLRYLARRWTRQDATDQDRARISAMEDQLQELQAEIKETIRCLQLGKDSA
jgi:hypothetical protein